MNISIRIVFLLALFFIAACGDPTADTDSNTITNTSTADSSNSDDNKTTSDSAKTVTIPAIVHKDCEVVDKHHDKNIFLAKDAAKLICVVANQETLDKDLGDSHRVFEVLSTLDCSSIFKKVMPINRSADFPYYIIPNTYESTNQIIAIQGFNSIYYYDVKNNKLTGPIDPEFLKERDAVDAQSGMMKGLTVWGHYLLGRSVDFGNFAFDISDKNNPKPVLPVAEYLIPKTEEYNNLFILDAGNGLSQAILPTTDIDAGGSMFDLDKMFSQPLKVNTSLSKNVRNNRFIILNDSTIPSKEQKVVIDMFSKKRIDLPSNMATKKTGEILNWLNNQ